MNECIFRVFVDSHYAIYALNLLYSLRAVVVIINLIVIPDNFLTLTIKATRANVVNISWLLYLSICKDIKHRIITTSVKS